MTATTTTSLQRDWILVVALFMLVLLAGASGVAVVTAPQLATQWLVLTTVVGTVELRYLRQHLDTNHPVGTEGLYDSLGFANAVTLTRGAAFAAVAGFAVVEPTPALAWMPALLYGSGCLLDWVDGFTARILGRTTVLGTKLDMAFDTLGVLVAPIVAVLWGRLPVWYLSLSAARYLFKAGRGLRRQRGKPIAELPPSVVRRPLAGVQMVFITVALAPVLSPETIQTLAAVVLPPSLIVFLRDYLVVACHLGRQKDHY
ncbi:CDP-alcohol phosphatidyltransferase family protein [Halocatena pleomorpha]|uniref:CDP-alcohol phosphatidyltransferase family protein n=1 Tax=Halocatena pleomorpha TaxID=1785090 RepID=A0A3P3RK53_9EURY|nr:CDP-alcohol phosphatidyltransferase family protein [Halocatena pleomorpha]RRJ33765.1 CDP-alcohol phosphatidyltransferase family protein [Halocatena pleomorpha]